MIQFRNVSFAFRNQPIFASLSFHLERGRYLVISGPHRSGKTSIVRMVAGLLLPNSGDIDFDGVSIRQIIRSAKRVREMRRKIGGVGGVYSLLSDRTILENISLPAEIEGQPSRQVRKNALEACGKYGLTHIAAHFPNKVSEVERRTALLARAEASMKNLIVADSPTDGLDEKSARFINEQLAALSLAGVSILYLTSGTGPKNGPSQYLRLGGGTFAE